MARATSPHPGHISEMVSGGGDPAWGHCPAPSPCPCLRLKGAKWAPQASPPLQTAPSLLGSPSLPLPPLELLGCQLRTSAAVTSLLRHGESEPSLPAKPSHPTTRRERTPCPPAPGHTGRTPLHTRAGTCLELCKAQRFRTHCPFRAILPPGQVWGGTLTAAAHGGSEHVWPNIALPLGLGPLSCSHQLCSRHFTHIHCMEILDEVIMHHTCVLHHLLICSRKLSTYYLPVIFAYISHSSLQQSCEVRFFPPS